MHNFVQITIFLPTPFLQRGAIFVFTLSLSSTIYEVDHPWGLSSHGEFLGVLISNF